MRIACVYVPQFALQCVTRIDPSLRGAPVAVVGGGGDGEGETKRALHSPVVLACSRAAWALGARIGMTALTARALSPELRVIASGPSDVQLEKEAVRAIADALLGVSPVVDLGGRVGSGGAHLALYCGVPSKTRGGTFGDRLIDRLEAMGLSCRIGIADDRFTAWVAASSPAGAARDSRAEDVGVVTVPRGGSAAFLAPRSLSLLAISPEVQRMLESLGVRTLGEFAALPAPSVSRPVESDYQALARGDSGSVLRPYAPDAPISEQVAIAAALSGPAAVAMLASRIAIRLAGRRRGATRLEVTAGGAAGERIVTVGLASGTLETAESLADAIGSAAGELGAVWRLRASVIGEEVAAWPFERGAANANAAAAAPETGEAPLVDDAELGEAVVRATDAYRRTQRGKRRPRTGDAAVDALIQSKLWKTLS